MPAPHLARLASFSLLAIVAACSSDDGDGGEPPPEPRTVASFDATKGELPEGLALRGGAAYVGFAPTGTIARVDLANGSFAAFAKVPHPGFNQGFMTGLAFDAAGSLYAAMVSFSNAVTSGIYRVGSEGGDATLFAQHADMAFPNGLEFDPSGRLWVTDSAKGAVFQIATGGAVTLFSDDPLLKCQRGFCGAGTDAGFEVGANGIALGEGVVYVANSDKATIVELTVGGDGKVAGVRNRTASSCEQLGGADGLVRGADGALFVAANRLNQVVRVEPSGAISVRGRGGPLDFPASLSVESTNLWITSFALTRATTNAGPKPALVRMGL